MSTVSKHLMQIQSMIHDAAIRSHRDPQSITLVAVSKRQPIESILEAYDAGQRHFGENYAQELRDKALALSHLKDICWHFIGNLQRNKVKYVAPTAAVMECIDSVRIAQEFSARARQAQRTVDVFLQVNVGEEEQKSGCAKTDAPAIARQIRQLPGIRLTGLMTIPPFHLEANETRLYFSALRELRDSMGGQNELPHLSMGMSHDFQEAIAEGATMVRVGTAIFGDRPPKPEE
ncbi:MAG: YggS family pyridoxal phosphate-dependent enzyme [Deltaproteobacteria bacterium]|nr:YggS family pyridoxal phosphate-dependent enzyme [Deltaproteobacteria bacterium]